MTNTELKAQIDSQITNETSANAITPTDVGTNLKSLVDYIDQEKRPYKVYSATITQSYEDAPTVVIYENTIGNIVWTRGAAGEYYGTLSTAFTSLKTMIPNSEAILQSDGSAVASGVRIYVQNVNSVIVNTKQNNINADSILSSGYSFEIRVYN